MTVLLDTQYLLWAIAADPRLSGKAKLLLEDQDHELMVSIASLWEIAIKLSIGKLKLIGGFKSVREELTNSNIQVIPVTIEHMEIVSSLPLHHRDPFDRMIIAQAKVEGSILMTSDVVFKRYEVQLLEI